jgi:hypothetical protein
MRVASLALMEKLSDLRVRMAMQQARTVRLHNPSLEARMQALALRVVRTEDSLLAHERQLSAGGLEGGSGGGVREAATRGDAVA